MIKARSLQPFYSAYQLVQTQKNEEQARRNRRFTALQRHLGLDKPATLATSNGGFRRMEMCRDALSALDRYDGGKYRRSYHQRDFHDNFIRACARIFWKTERPGAFARDHQRILEANGWSNLSQEVLISTPRRFGKTFSVSMFAAAMLFSTAALEMSIYSTCKRISQKLLRNVYKFLSCIYEATGHPKMHEIRFNCEEIVLQGWEGSTDIRIVNSYPSKVSPALQISRGHVASIAEMVAQEPPTEATQVSHVIPRQHVKVNRGPDRHHNHHRQVQNYARKVHHSNTHAPPQSNSYTESTENTTSHAGSPHGREQVVPPHRLEPTRVRPSARGQKIVHHARLPALPQGLQRLLLEQDPGLELARNLPHDRTKHRFGDAERVLLAAFPAQLDTRRWRMGRLA